jgi:hypothetical protein
MLDESSSELLYEDVPIPHFCRECNRFAIVPPTRASDYDSPVKCTNCGKISRWTDVDPKIPDPSFD